MPNSALGPRARAGDGRRHAGASGLDASDAVFTIDRAGGDALGPARGRGQRSSRARTPIDNTAPATLTAPSSTPDRRHSNDRRGRVVLRRRRRAPAGTGQPDDGHVRLADGRRHRLRSTRSIVRPRRTRPVGARAATRPGNWGQALAPSVWSTASTARRSAVRAVDFELSQNAPNPVHARRRRSRIALPSAAATSTSRSSTSAAAGSATLADGAYAAGVHRDRWDRADAERPAGAAGRLLLSSGRAGPPVPAAAGHVELTQLRRRGVCGRPRPSAAVTGVRLRDFRAREAHCSRRGRHADRVVGEAPPPTSGLNAAAQRGPPRQVDPDGQPGDEEIAAGGGRRHGRRPRG